MPRTSPFALALAVLIAVLIAVGHAPAARAGGAVARLIAPASPGSPYTVETLHCGTRHSFDIAAFAEGRVDGRLQSIPLRLERGDQPGVFALRRQWPAGGRWVIRLVPGLRGAASSVTPIGADGSPGEPRVVFGGDGRREARAALASR